MYVMVFGSFGECRALRNGIGALTGDPRGHPYPSIGKGHNEKWTVYNWKRVLTRT